MLSFLLVTCLFFVALRFKHGFVATLFLPSLFFYYLAFEMRDSALSAEYFEFERVSDYNVYLLFGLFITVSTLIAFSPLTRNGLAVRRSVFLKSRNRLPNFSTHRSAQFYYVFAAASLLAFLVNIARVQFDISLLFIAPRLYEEIFGQSTAINYIYFLNVPALCISIYHTQHAHRLKFSRFINALLILISFFHGIKFTVFDTLLLPAFFYFHQTRNPARAIKTLSFVMILLLAFYLSFGMFVRGSTEDEGPLLGAVLNYILPNYYNFALSIATMPLQFDPLTHILPDKIPNPLSEILPTGNYGFTLNDRFNMATAFVAYYSALPVISWLLFLPIMVHLRLRILRIKKLSPKIHWIFIAGYFDFCIFFTWYFHAFNKTKYVYYVIVMLVVGVMVHSRRQTKRAPYSHQDVLPHLSRSQQHF